MRLTFLVIPLLACTENNFSNIADSEKGNGPRISITPDTLNFGTARPEDTPVPQSFAISNIGQSDLEVTDLQIQGTDAASFFLVEPFSSFMLPPGASRDVDVVFTPNGANDLMAEVYVSSTDEIDPVLPVGLIGYGAVPELSIIPNPLDMGTMYVGCDTTNQLILSNTGSDDLNIYAIDHTGGVFSLVSVPALPLTLAPGGFTTVDIQYVPELDEVSEGALLVVSDEPENGGIREATQIGVGEYIDEHIQNWENPVDPPSDILFSVDLSCSMDDDAARLGNNFQSFINQLSNYSNDWQIMVANNDNGCSNSGVLTPSTSNYQSIFSSSVGCCEGADTERLLTIAQRAIEQTDSSECNAGFLRSNAMLHLVLVSDEPEQSYTSWQSLVDQIIAKKGAPEHVKVSAIAGDYPHGCSTADPAYGYWDAVNYTGGVFLSICSDWSNPSNLELLAEASVISDSYPLDYPAAETTIEVYVNGQPIVGTWHYDASLNSVVFDSGAPAEGDTILISYGEIAVCD
ncbi:MAG: choice-of-anchor D domain-containing protein [Myxococcota bacterium]|nr:choice-of-anchor D domain-containing protein [Myxococcota bacterium]